MRHFGAGPPRRFLRRLTEPSVLSFLTIAAVLFVGMYPLLSTGLRPVDDHEYLSFRLINPSGSLWAALVDASFRTAGELEGARWRPLYHFGRSLTTALISDSTAPRYAFRLLLTSFVVWGLATRLTHAFGPALRSSALRYGAIITVSSILLSTGNWIDVSTRLGPQELFGLAGVTVYVLALNATPVKRHQISLVGGIVAMSGFKESFTVLAVLLLSATFALSPAHRRRETTYIALAISVFSLAISTLVVRAKDHTDFYGNERTLTTYLESLGSFLRSPLFGQSAVLLLVAVLIAEKERRVQIVMLGNVAFLVLLSEWTIYGASMSLYGRYEIVSSLVARSILAIVILFFLGRLATSAQTFRTLQYILSCGFCLAMGALTQNTIGGFYHASSDAHRDSADWFMAVNEVLQEDAEGNFHQVLIIVDVMSASDTGRLEKSQALMNFLDYYSPRARSFFLTVQELPPGAKLDTFTGAIRANLERTSEFGSSESRIWRSEPVRLKALADLDPTGGLLCIHYSHSGRQHAFSSACQSMVRFQG